FLQVFNGGAQTITLTGLNVPSAPLLASDAYMTTLTWEGDASLAVTTGNPLGDYVKVNGTTASLGVNRLANFWNGTISKNGNFVTTKNPNFRNQMSIDIDELEVGIGYGISSNATVVNIEFGSEADQYFPSLFAFTIRSKDPEIILNKAVSDGTSPFGLLQISEILTYTLSGINLGTAPALNCTVVDTLPGNVIYVPGSMEVVSCPGFPNNCMQSDLSDADYAFKGMSGLKTYLKFYIGTGKTSTTGGTLQPGETYTIRFKVITPAIVPLLSSVINTARITGQNAFGDQFVDDGTASIIAGSVMAVKLTSFTVKKENSNAVLRWITSGETKNSHFEIERSVDGINFSTVGNIAGNGTTSLTRNYSFSDPLANITAKILYYRLKDIDMDGKGAYSQVVALRMDGTVVMTTMLVYPNPFASNFKLQVNSQRQEASSIRLISMNGQQVLRRDVTLQAGENIIVVKDLESVAPGIYIMEFRTGNDVMTQKLIKK
ncbi:MAG TPA: T9SS type A sorting domain-containing protein, partial [Ferruginibacter sp.]|nr:T9SS type A sorting domain-containing protein [Ferruginibacter sp.]